jgi:hypothetical protein
MYQKIVMTGGISLFVYRNLFGQLTRDKELFRFEGTNPFPKDGGSAEEEMQTWLKEMGSSFFKIQGREKNISAEYSMLCSLKINNKVVERPLFGLHCQPHGH